MSTAFWIVLFLASVWAVSFCLGKVGESKEAEREAGKRACKLNSEPGGEFRRMT